MIKAIRHPNGTKNEIQIDSDLDWLAPYLTKAIKYGVPVWRIGAIKGYFVPSDKQERQMAATIKGAGNSKAVITILKWHQEWRRCKDGRYEVSGWHSADFKHYFECTLESLAHELTHLVHWKHSADRYILEKRIQLGFSRMAKKRGYIGYD